MTSGSQVEGLRCAAQRTANDQEALALQKTQAVADRAVGTGQSADQLLVSTRYHPSGALLISCQPEEKTLLKPREAARRHDAPPDACAGPGGPICGDGALGAPIVGAPISRRAVCPDRLARW